MQKRKVFSGKKDGAGAKLNWLLWLRAQLLGEGLGARTVPACCSGPTASPKKKEKRKKEEKKRKFRLGFLSNVTLAGSLPLCVPMPISQNVGAKRGGAALRFHQLAEQTPAASPCCPHVPAANFQMPDGKCLGLQLKAPGAPCTRDPHEQHGFVESGCRTWLGPVHLQRQGQARGLLWCFHAENPSNPTHSGHPFLHAAMASSEQSCRKPRGSAEPLL